MIKKYMKTLIVTSLLSLSPIIVGVILWDKLPEQMPIPFGADNAADGFAGKPFAVFGLPLTLVAIEWLCMFATKMDPKVRNLDDSVMMKIVLWIMPCLSLVLSAVTYSYSLGNEVRVGFIVISFVGVLMVVMGNYLPKCKQSYTMGIKLPWTLRSAENWNRTHRFAGKLWVVCGLVMLATAVLENSFVFIGLLIVMVTLPTVYSYRIK